DRAQPLEREGQDRRRGGDRPERHLLLRAYRLELLFRHHAKDRQVLRDGDDLAVHQAAFLPPDQVASDEGAVPAAAIADQPPAFVPLDDGMVPRRGLVGDAPGMIVEEGVTPTDLEALAQPDDARV